MIPKYLQNLKRGPQVILPKDAGMIISFAGICKESFVLNAGAGSGWLDVQIGRIAKKVVSYEKREEFAQIAQKNIAKAGLQNVEVRIRDVIESGFDEKGADAAVLDMANSHLAVSHAISALKEDGVLVGYLPHTNQMQEFVLACESLGWADTYCVENILREMLVRPAGVRPENVGVMHTAYLVFARKGEKIMGKREEKRSRKR
ncbi:MAG: rRNA adenine N-6-methyltransferase family protein [Candidatus Micrarchaeota archaeon]